MREFIFADWLRIALLSALALVPCYWHSRIQATDLGSHVYNAWLANLIEQGSAPGLWLSPQTSNILFDLMLSKLLALGPVAAEKITVSFAVLVFFWGAFALCSAAAKRPAWSVVPVLLMATYGFKFHMGFFNSYLSTGLSLFALAIVWSGRRWDFALLAPLTVLTWTAHPLGVAALAAIGTMMVLARLLSGKWHVLLTAAAVGMYFVVRWFAGKKYMFLPPETDLHWMLGPDQLVIYGSRYKLVAAAVLAVAMIGIVLALVRNARGTWQAGSFWLQIYAVAALVVMFAPGTLVHPELQLLGYLSDRASLYTLVLMACVLAAIGLKRWQLVGFGAVAVMFFSMVYMDGKVLDVREARIAEAVAKLSPGQRVVPVFFSMLGSRIHEDHALDRACIGRCFTVNNYEPGLAQFRVRARPENRIVAANSGTAKAMEFGTHIVRPEDLPLTAVYACGPGLGQICTHELSTGERTGERAVQEVKRYGVKR